MADRQWVSGFGDGIHEEGDEEFVDWFGTVISENQADIVISSFLSGNFIIRGNIAINKD